MPPTTRAKARQSELAKGSRLLKLPAELRNYIYELSFSTNQHDDEVMDIFTALAPEKSLLLVCHQVYNEACQLYKIAFRNFCTSGKFSMEVEQSGVAFYTYFEALQVPQLEHVVHFHVNWLGFTMTLLDRRGGWHMRYKLFNDYLRIWYARGNLRAASHRTESEFAATYDAAAPTVSLHKQLLDYFGTKPEQDNRRA